MLKELLDSTRMNSSVSSFVLCRMRGKRTSSMLETSTAQPRLIGSRPTWKAKKNWIRRLARPAVRVTDLAMALVMAMCNKTQMMEMHVETIEIAEEGVMEATTAIEATEATETTTIPMPETPTVTPTTMGMEMARATLAVFALKTSVPCLGMTTTLGIVVTRTPMALMVITPVDRPTLLAMVIMVKTITMRKTQSNIFLTLLTIALTSILLSLRKKLMNSKLNTTFSLRAMETPLMVPRSVVKILFLTSLNVLLRTMMTMIRPMMKMMMVLLKILLWIMCPSVLIQALTSRPSKVSTTELFLVPSSLLMVLSSFSRRPKLFVMEVLTMLSTRRPMMSLLWFLLHCLMLLASMVRRVSRQ